MMGDKLGTTAAVPPQKQMSAVQHTEERANRTTSTTPQRDTYKQVFYISMHKAKTLRSSVLSKYIYIY